MTKTGEILARTEYVLTIEDKVNLVNAEYKKVWGFWVWEVILHEGKYAFVTLGSGARRNGIGFRLREPVYVFEVKGER